MHGSPQANVGGGILLLHLDLWGIEGGGLPLDNSFSTAIDRPQ